MDKAAAQKLVRETLRDSFDKGRFVYLLKNILKRFDESKAFHARGHVKEKFRTTTPIVKTYERTGTYSAPDGKKTDLLIVYLQKESSIDRARTALRNFVADYLKQRDMKDAALVAFVPPDGEDWRFSFIKMEYKFNEKGKVKEEFTPARRFSFLVGKNETSHTAQSRLLPLLLDDEGQPTLKDLEDAFSVEKTTKEFFEKYRDLFLRLKEALDSIVEKDQKIKVEFKSKQVSVVDFTKKLLGQIVFLYFLQKKGWFGVQRGCLWGSGSKHFLRELFNKKHGDYKNFFNDILEPLFYEALRLERPADYYKHFDCRIPFLNGGLFDPINDYDWVETEILLPDDLFSNDRHTKEGDVGDGILDVFDRYNFTVKEDEPLEKEVAVDPEMLGKVFENLLEIKNRKSKGTYYTPREIVHYMCQESLIEYLYGEFNPEIVAYETIGDDQMAMFGNEAKKKQLDLTIQHRQRSLIDKKDIETLIRHGESVVEHERRVVSEGREIGRYSFKLPGRIRANALRIDEKLAGVRVCDPAVGSGAFVVGMMNEIIRARGALTPHVGENQERTVYDFKRHAIQNCLYGVDVDSGAIEIAKLRLWLSLVVDEEERESIQPLPNLDYKIVCGNSLLGVNKLFNHEPLKKLEALKPLYFNETSAVKKQKHKKQIDDLISQMTNGHKDFDFEVYFSEVFHEKKGFDVTIGNPPYVRADSGGAHREMRQRIEGSNQYETLWEKWDLYIPFIERSYKLLKHGGFTTMIVSDAYCHSKYAQKSQNWFLQNSRILRLDFFSKIRIFDAAVRNVTYLFQKADGSHHKPERWVHEPKFGAIKPLPTDEQCKLTHRAFFPEDADFQQFSAPTVPLNKICYISVGMVVHADEKRAQGAFELKDLVADEKDKRYPKPFVEGKHLERWLPAENKWLEWGTKRAPDLFRRPTFPEMYEVGEKLISVDMAAGVEKLRVAYDDQRLYHNHSAWSFIPWHSLSGVRNGSIKKSTRYRDEKPKRPDLPQREELEKTSRCFAVKFLLGVMNSTAAHDFLRANRRSNIHLYPDDWKKLPIPDVTAGQQEPIIELVDQILNVKRTNPNADVSALEAELDQLVYKLYGLTTEENALIKQKSKA